MVYTFDVSNINYFSNQISYFKIVKVYNIRLQRYRDKKVRIRGKDLIPLYFSIYQKKQ